MEYINKSLNEIENPTNLIMCLWLTGLKNMILQII